MRALFIPAVSSRFIVKEEKPENFRSPCPGGKESGDRVSLHAALWQILSSTDKFRQFVRRQTLPLNAEDSSPRPYKDGAPKATSPIDHVLRQR